MQSLDYLEFITRLCYTTTYINDETRMATLTSLLGWGPYEKLVCHFGSRSGWWPGAAGSRMEPFLPQTAIYRLGDFYERFNESEKHAYVATDFC
jgi:hypothetical protein